MNQTSEISEKQSPIHREIDGNVTFNNVSFRYPGTEVNVLNNISFKVSAGQTVAIVGTTGSGKTTLTKLISRLYDIHSGQIEIDGIDIKDYAFHSLRDQISYIEQDIFLFSKNVMDNILFGRDASEDAVIQAAKDAQAHDFIIKLPQGYETSVGERGVQLSGGERQRIAIARAFLSNPKILILDDSTSAIDSETEEKIQIAISRILKGRTTFIITHRLSQIRWADKILVLANGKIIAQGSHEDLLRTCEEYRKIFVTRFDKTLEELLEVQA
ncbi:MAG: ATP-binding cassette domain-containing protein [Candidatus Lokiarchaeota archaeon]|nr:ATP-binding cassette domain-containing protein [Candidatus Harpocratesius repetitus]